MNISLLKRKPKTEGFSLVELFIVVSVIGVLAAIAIPFFSSIRSNTLELSVETGVKTLNSAVSAYIANGGEIPDDADIEAVIAKLKTVRANDDDTDSIVAFGGSFIDRRIQVEQDLKQDVGLRWDNATKRFETDTSAGRFQLVMSEEPSPIVEEERNGSIVAWGDDWIWSYSDNSSKIIMSPTPVSLVPEPDPEPYVYTGPSISITPTTQEILSVGANSAENPGFEGPNGFNSRVQTWGGRGLKAYTTKEENVEGWNTTASDGLIEVWQNGFGGVDSYEGDFHVEFNANEVSTLWQEVTVAGMDVVNISFAHGQRSRNTEQLKLMVGTTQPARKVNSNQEEDLEGLGMAEILRTDTNAVKGWELYSHVYEVPEGVTKLYFAFQSFGAFAGRSYGNFLDDVRFEGATQSTLSGIGFDISAGNSISNVIQSAKIRLEEPEFQDNIDLLADLPDHFSYEKTYGDDFIELTITGAAFRHEYADFLETVSFTTSSTETHDRSILFSVNDGYAVSDQVEYLVEFN